MLTEQMNRSLEFLREALPPADRMMIREDVLRSLIRTRWAQRESVPWGMEVPDEIFYPYVLFPRVNNEDFVFSDPLIVPLLRDRLSGLRTAGEAALEINHWCLEVATYRSTDDRTANALTVMRRGFGRCGEESVLLVTALRCCGVPARQIYAPLWSHCDDNHAWVEVWTEGEWRYLGACEPEPVLNSGWFTAAASKAMLMHTRAWGLLPSGERCEARENSAYVINRTAFYARTALLTLRVTENGGPAAGADVSFCLANMGAFRPICRKATDADGRCDLLCGLGSVYVCIRRGGRLLGFMADTSVRTDYDADLSRASDAWSDVGSFSQHPPAEMRTQPWDFPPELLKEHERRIAAADEARAQRLAVYSGGDPLTDAARGNRPVVEAFLRRDPGQYELRRALLSTLREKDLVDVTDEVLEDALCGALPFRGRCPEEVWRESVLCPRVAAEMLYPHRAFLSGMFAGTQSPRDVWNALCARLRTEPMYPETLIPDLRAAVRADACSPLMLDILFVAVCRSLGIPARLDPVTGAKCVWQDGSYRPLLDRERTGAVLVLENATGSPLAGNVDFSVTMFTETGARVLGLSGTTVRDTLTLSLAPGRYRVMTVCRQIDGTVDGVSQLLTLEDGRTETVRLAPSEDHTASALRHAALPPIELHTPQGTVTLPEAFGKRPAIVACVVPGHEPCEHLLAELTESAPVLSERGVGLCLILCGSEGKPSERLGGLLAALPETITGRLQDDSPIVRWRELLGARELRYPLAIAVSSSGEGLYASVNYRVGLAQTLLRVLDTAGALAESAPI